jgi:hypothetical protein
MRTTTVAWQLIPDISAEDLQANRKKLHDAAANIAGDLYREDINQTVNNENGLLTVTRSWPDAEKAQAWVDYVLAEGAVSAQVNPE